MIGQAILVHVAAPPALDQQRCAECGEVLLDLTESGLVICTAGPPRLLVWPTGYAVALSADGRSAWLASSAEEAAFACSRAGVVH